MRGIRRLIPFALCCVACGSSPFAPGGDQPLALARLQPGSGSFAYYTALRESQRLIVRDQAQWQDVWTAIWRTHTATPPLPAIDFTREMVVVAALGERPSGGFSIFVDSAFESAVGVTIAIRTVSPGSGCGVTAVFTQPVDIARLPLRTASITFDERPPVLACQ
jgi:hypothetical protein